MAYPVGAVQITGTIGTTSILDTYSTHQDYLGFGGLRAVADTTARDAITTARRTFGMIVTTQDGSGSYILSNVAMGGADNVESNNANWLAYSPGGGGTYTNANPTTIAVGGYPIGSTFSTAQTMQQMWDGLLYPYIPPTFASFSISAFTTSYEVGATISGSQNFTWSFTNAGNVAASSMAILDVTASTTLASGLSITPPAAVVIATFTPTSPTTYSWQGKAVNTQTTNFFSAFFTASWFWRAYYGTSALASLTATDIQSLVNNPLSSTEVGTYSFAAGDYKYFCWPDSFGSPSAGPAPNGFVSGGFGVSMADASDDAFYALTQNGWSYGLVSVTNINGVATNYRVYRTKNTLGSAVVISVN